MAEMKRIFIAPTGDEIAAGIVRDIDSPELMSLALAAFPQAEVTRISPILDVENTILERIQSLMEQAPDLIVLIGGSGGGHRFSQSLGKDFTHTALGRYLEEYSSHEIYGKNGHMWSKLIIGRKGGSILINVPGPYVEAKAAFAAFLEGVEKELALPSVNRAMAEAVLGLYPERGAEVK